MSKPQLDIKWFTSLDSPGIGRSYCDENVEIGFIHNLRKKGLNVVGVHDIPGAHRKPDEWHAAEAHRRGRVLITQNGRHFWPDRILPPSQTHGVIVIPNGLSLTVVDGVALILRSAGRTGLQGSKVAVSDTGVVVKVTIRGDRRSYDRHWTRSPGGSSRD